MKISNLRLSKQPISAYDQSRIDAAKQKSDARVISRAIADKATAEYHKSLLDTEKIQLDLQKAHVEYNQTIALAELTRLNNEQTCLRKEALEVEAIKTRLEAEKIKLETNKTQLEIEITQNNTVQAQLQMKQEETKKVQLYAEMLQLNTTKVLAKANAMENNAIIISSQLELERINLEKARLDLEISHVNNAPAYAAKAQADALIFVQRSKIMKTLQVLGITSCKRVDELYFNKSVTSITNVYQKTYNNNKYATGFGDFIRGCYFMLDFCEIFHFQPNIVFNHPLIEFLEKSYISHNYDVDENKVCMFEHNNWNKNILNRDNIIINTIRKNDTMPKFVDYLCNSPIDNNNNINIYNTLFPYFDISAEHKKVMCDILKPSPEMKEYVVSTLNEFELSENNYISIHIRSGDNYLTGVDKQFNTKYLTHITNNITMLLNKYPDTYFLLIADNNFIKLHLSSQKLVRLCIVFNEIGHLGENTQLERNKVMNTMLDFYLFSYSSYIYAFSSYDHGSGFSFWCAKTYGIPYSCKIIKH